MAERIAGLTHLDLTPWPHAAQAGLVLAERPFRAKVGLRGRHEVQVAASRALGFELPTTVGAVGSGRGMQAFWIGPEDWVIVAEPGLEQALAIRLRQACGGLHHAVIDITERMTTFCLSGAHVRDALAAGCPLDLHPRVFTPGTMLASQFGKANVFLHFVAGNDERPFIDLYVNRSLADYVLRLLVHAGQEFGCDVQA